MSSSSTTAATGRSEGWPSEQGTYNDVLAAYEWLRREKSVAPEKLVVQGESLGCAIAIELAPAAAHPGTGAGERVCQHTGNGACSLPVVAAAPALLDPL